MKAFLSLLSKCKSYGHEHILNLIIWVVVDKERNLQAKELIQWEPLLFDQFQNQTSNTFKKSEFECKEMNWKEWMKRKNLASHYFPFNLNYYWQRNVFKFLLLTRSR